jgi:hypothetical protein
MFIMDKDPTKSETALTPDRIRGLGEAAMILGFLKEADDFSVNDGPQHLGIMDPVDKLEATKDPRTINVEVDGQLIPVFVPIEYHFDANQTYFEGKSAYFFNWQDYNPQFEQQITDKLTTIPIGSLIMLEHEAEDTEAEQTLQKLITNYSGRQIDIDRKCLDPKNKVVANVIYYYSETHRPNAEVPTYLDISTAYEALKDTDEWKDFEGKGVQFVSGEDIAPHLKDGKTSKLLEDLWVVYDETFNKLIKDHPSDQKIPREYFDLLTTSPNSRVTYAIDNGNVVSALFVLEDLEDLPWLNQKYFRNLNKTGRNVFMPGIATKVDYKKAVSNSPKLIEAMSFLAQCVPDITGIATQCTNVSARYVPRLTNRYTQGTMNANMKEIKKYEYPVYKVFN